MAIKVDINYRGIDVHGAYVTASVLSISLEKNQISFGAWYRASQDDEPFQAVTYTAPYDLNGVNPFAQAYAHLKSLPEFEGAEDI